VLLFGLLQRVTFTLHTRPYRGTHGWGPCERRDHPTLQRGGVLETYSFGRRRLTLLEISLVLLRGVIANDRRIVGTATRAHAQQSQDNQKDTERLHALILVQMRRAARGIRGGYRRFVGAISEDVDADAGLRSGQVLRRHAVRGMEHQAEHLMTLSR
jgi:hypothetical protein